jgi:hypothetical protein
VHLSQEKAARLSRYLARHEDVRLAATFLTPEYEIVRRAEASADGRIDDEAADLDVAEGHLIERFHEGDKPGAEMALREMQAVTARMQSEVDRL